MSANHPDPFTQVERLLWFIVESHPGFAERVPVGNRIKLCEDDPEGVAAKRPDLTADKPEMTLVPSGGTGDQNRTSSSKGFVQNYEFRMATSFIQTQGDNAANQIQRGINALKWEIVKAFSHWTDAFAGLPFVKRVDLVPVSDVEDDPDRDSRGWSSIITVSVTMHWPHAEVERWAE